jgi:hypothetical protein
MTQGQGPSLIPLTQLSLSEILGGSLNAIKKMPKTLLGIGLFSAFIIGISTVLFSAFLVSNNIDISTPALPDLTSTITPAQLQEFINALTPTLQVTFFTAFVLFLVQTFSTVLFTHVIGNAITGKKINSSEAWQKSKPQLLKAFGLSVISVILPLMVLVSGFLIGAGVGATFGNSTVGTILIFVSIGVGAGLALYIWVGLFVATPALILEDSKFIESIKRSFLLTRSKMFRVFGIGLVGIITAQAISIVVSTPFLLFAGNDPDQANSTNTIFLTAMGAIIGYTFALPFTATFTALLYTDLRIRKENLIEQIKKIKN